MKKPVIILFMVFIAANAQAGLSALTLNLISSVRGDALGGSCSALMNEIDGIYCNPASIKILERNEIITSYMARIEGMYCANLCYGAPIDKDSSFGLSLALFDAGSMEVNYFDGSSTIKKAQTEYLFGIYYARKITKDMDAGIGCKILYSTLAEDYKAYAFAFDAGIKYFMFEDIIIAASILNIGPAIKYINEGDALPLTGYIGAAYPVKFSKTDVLNISADAQINLTDKTKVSAGVEYIYDNLISVRAGYRFGQDIGSITAGVGARYNIENAGVIGFDYAYIYGNEWFDTHKVSIVFKF